MYVKTSLLNFTLDSYNAPFVKLIQNIHLVHIQQGSTTTQIVILPKHICHFQELLFIEAIHACP